MKKIILILLFGLPIYANAGLLGFLGDVASISSAMSSGHQPVSQDELKKANTYLWSMVRRKEYVEGYEFLADLLAKSGNVMQVDTAAQAYFDNGQKEKAIDLYERRVLPLGRVLDRGYEVTYKRMVGLKSNQKIDYAKIYKRLKRNEQPKVTSEQYPIEFAIWGIFVMLLINLGLKIMGLMKSGSATKQEQQKVESPSAS